MKKSLKPNNMLFPMPLVVLATYNEDRTVDCMTAAWITMEDEDVLFVELTKDHKTSENILRDKVFSVSVVSKDEVVNADFVGMVSANHDRDKFRKTGWTATRGTALDVPVIEELRLTYECELLRVSEEDGEFGIYARIRQIDVDNSILDEKGRLDIDKAEFVTFVSSEVSYRVLGEKVGKAFSDGKKKII